MSEQQDKAIYTFLRIPIPIGTAGAFIWAVAAFIQKWDPNTYPDFKTVFSLPLMRFYTATVIIMLLTYYVYTSFDWLRMAILRVRIKIAERHYPKPSGMVLVPKGSFLFHFTGKRVFLDDFFIDKYLVTNEDYRTFIQESNHLDSFSYAPSKARHPVTNISWDDAKEYCKWRSKKIGRKVTLPTEQQWEKAARGPFGYDYPWGNKFDPERCNVGGPEGDTNEVDAYPNGTSPYGCFDMCGNIWEWTDSWFDEENGIIILKGGSYYFGEEFCPLWIPYNDPKTDKWFDLGFRCVAWV